MAHIWKRSNQDHGDSHSQYMLYTQLPDPAPWSAEPSGSMRNRGEISPTAGVGKSGRGVCDLDVNARGRVGTAQQQPGFRTHVLSNSGLLAVKCQEMGKFGSIEDLSGRQSHPLSSRLA